MICQKTFNINYLFYLLSDNDSIFLNNNYSSSAYLKALIEVPLLHLLNSIWLTNSKPPSLIFSNKNVINFLKKHTKIISMITNDKIRFLIKNDKAEREKYQILMKEAEVEKKIIQKKK